MTTTESKKLDELAKALNLHIKESLAVDKMREEKIDRLMPLAELIPSLEMIVEQQKITVGMNKRFAEWGRAILFIGGIIGAIYAIIGLIFRLEK